MTDSKLKTKCFCRLARQVEVPLNKRPRTKISEGTAGMGEVVSGPGLYYLPATNRPTPHPNGTGGKRPTMISRQYYVIGATQPQI